MIVYHGSNHRFKTLRVDKKLVKSNASELNEGLGIYFSLDKDVVASYGKYIYTLVINDNELKDFRDMQVVKSYLLSIRKSIVLQTKLDIADFMSLRAVAEIAHKGVIAISGIGREIEMTLDNTEEWSMLGEKKVKPAVNLLKTFDKASTLKAYMFPYHIRNVGIIRDTSIANIINVERIN